MNWWTVAWLLWALGFVVIEGAALINSTAGDTLSEHFWAWLGVTRGKPVGTVVRPTKTMRWARVAFVCGMAWVTVHLATGWA